MLNPQDLRKDLDTVVGQLARRGHAFDRAAWQKDEDQRKHLAIQVQAAQSQRNALAKAIGLARSKGEPFEGAQAQAIQVNEDLAALEGQMKAIEDRLNDQLLRVPNLPLAEVPDGTGEADNVEIVRWGTPRDFAFAPQDHVALGSGGLDAEGGVRLAGSRFTVLMGPLARLHRALAQFMLDLHTRRHGYLECNVPVLVHADIMQGTGQLPKFAEDMFQTQVNGVDRYLIPTAEVPLTNLVREQILPAEGLPLRLTAHSLCFRAEAGAAGRDTRGLIRQHQFEKVELVQVVPPELGLSQLEEMVGHAEAVLQALELPYRKVLLCAGDMGFSSSKTYDLEVWLPSQKTYREISSCSLCGEFQARRMQARWRNPATGKPDYVHTLNGSGVAVGRALVALLENHQQADGRVRLPAALVPYYGQADWHWRDDLGGSK